MCVYLLAISSEAANPNELKVCMIISLGIQMILGLKLPDSNNRSLENRKNR